MKEGLQSVLGKAVDEQGYDAIMMQELWYKGVGKGTSI